MTNKHLHHIFIILAGILTLLHMSCTQERQPCITPRYASLLLKTVRPSTTGTALDTPMPSAVFGAITDSGTKGIIFPQSATFSLSLSPVSDSCRWIFAPDTAVGTLLDTILLKYTRQLEFISNACGYTYFYSLSDVTSTNRNIDSIIVTNTSVTNNVNNSHLQVYIRPQP